MSTVPGYRTRLVLTGKKLCKAGACAPVPHISPHRRQRGVRRAATEDDDLFTNGGGEGAGGDVQEVGEAPVGGNGRGHGRAPLGGRGGKPHGLFLLSLPRLPLFPAPVVPFPPRFLRPLSSFLPQLVVPLPSSFACTRCPLPSFCFVHSLPPYFLFFCTCRAPSFFLADCPPSSQFALAVPLPPSVRGIGDSGCKTGQK